MLNITKRTLFICVVLFIFLSIASVSAENATDANSTVKTYSDLNTQISEITEGDTLNLTDDYKFSNGTDDDFIEGINISKSMTIKGKDDYSYIDGSHLARGLFIQSNCNVVLQNLIIKNGYSINSGAGIYVDDNSNLTLINCILQSNKVYNSDGGGICAQSYTNVHVYNTIFDNNTSIRESDLEWSQFKAGMGAAIIARIGSTLELYESVFRNNDAYLAVILVVSYNDVKYKMSNLRVKGSLFEDNIVYNCGIIYQDELGYGEIEDSIFRGNLNTHSGGVLELDACIDCTVKNCTFENNYGTSGGAIKVKVFNTKYFSHVSIVDCDFNYNHAKNYGGAIYSDYGLLKITNCNFNRNVAGKHGGAIYTSHGEVDIKNCDFSKNSAVSFGGALYAHNDPVKITDCKFIQNSAKNGGGIYLLSEDSTISASSFSKNSADSKGGAIFANVETFKTSKLSYSKNTAKYASKVYGLFKVKVYQYTYTTKSVKLKLKITSPWGMSLSQRVKVKLTGAKSFTSKWLKTDSKGVVSVIVPFNVNIKKYKITVSFDEGVASVTSWSKIKDKAKIVYSKNVKKPSKIKLTIKNKATKKLIKKTKFKVKVYTGKKYKTYKIKTNSKGVLKIATSKLKRGKHKIVITYSSSKYNINNKIYVKIK